MRINKINVKPLLGVVGLCVFALAVFMGCGKSKAPGASIAQKDVVATVDGESITMADVDVRITKLPAYYQQMVKSHKKELVDDMVLEILLFNEAKKKGIDKDKEVKDLLREAERRILISRLIQKDVEDIGPISDQEVEEYYNSHKEEFAVPERWRASHILVKTEAEAKEVLNDLSKGKSFEELAKEKSQDSSASKGGDVGYFTKGQMVPEFEEAVTKLEVGKTSGIVKTQFGYHIVKLTDKKPGETQELKDVAARIKNEIIAKKRREGFDKLVGNLRAHSKIIINDSLLEEPKPETAPAVTEVPPAQEAAEQEAPVPAAE